MTGADPLFRLAPVGVLRCAAWPLSSLSGFGAEAFPQHSPATGTFEHDYDPALTRERGHLWRTTLDDPRFCKALALASPSAYSRCMAAGTRRAGRRNRAMRLAEHTLYRYLARAAARPTPHGMWAGVTEIAFGEYVAIERAAPHYLFTPDLRPFRKIFRTLAARPEYRRRALWQLNSTLAAEPHGGWFFFGRLEDGRLEPRAIEANAEFARLAPVLATLPPMPLERLAVEAADRAAWPLAGRAALREMLETLASAGVLVGGIDLPLKFDSPWTALAAAAETLGSGDRNPWSRTLIELQDRCATLSAIAEQSSAEEFVAQLAGARACVNALSREYRLADSGEDENAVRCDMRLPWRVTLDEARRSAILDALSDYDFGWLCGASPASAERDVKRHALAQRIAAGMPLAEAARLVASAASPSSFVWPPAEGVAEPAVASRIRAWEACLAGTADEVELTPPSHRTAGPTSALGSVFVGFVDGGRINVRSVTDLPALSSARFNQVLDRRLDEWIAGELRRSSTESGIDYAELRAPFETNPNVLAGASLLEHAIEPWSANPDALSLSGAQVRVHAETGRLVVELAGTNRPWCVLSLHAADVRSRDPLSQLLLYTGFNEFPDRRQRAIDVPTSAEARYARHGPRVTLPHGAVLRRRRTVIGSQSDLSSLANARGVARYRAWQQHARELGWPEHLRVSLGPGEPMLIHRDSPLGVEAVFKGLRPETPFVVVEEASLRDGLELGEGRHGAELALAFARQR